MNALTKHETQRWQTVRHGGGNGGFYGVGTVESTVPSRSAKSQTLEFTR
jgi:hypothetical protein